MPYIIVYILCNHRVRHQKPVLETITDIMSRRGSAISYIVRE